MIDSRQTISGRRQIISRPVGKFGGPGIEGNEDLYRANIRGASVEQCGKAIATKYVYLYRHFARPLSANGNIDKRSKRYLQDKSSQPNLIIQIGRLSNGLMESLNESSNHLPSAFSIVQSWILQLAACKLQAAS